MVRHYKEESLAIARTSWWSSGDLGLRDTSKPQQGRSWSGKHGPGSLRDTRMIPLIYRSVSRMRWYVNLFMNYFRILSIQIRTIILMSDTRAHRLWILVCAPQIYELRWKISAIWTFVRSIHLGFRCPHIKLQVYQLCTTPFGRQQILCYLASAWWKQTTLRLWIVIIDTDPWFDFKGWCGCCYCVGSRICHGSSSSWAPAATQASTAAGWNSAIRKIEICCAPDI